jgi:magnesium chelatase subunit H
VRDGRRQTDAAGTHLESRPALPETVALVLWGTDNLKTEGGPIAQALALIGAEPRLDSYGRVCGAKLMPLEELGRPRIDVVMTLSGIFRDLLPLQTRMLAEAAYLAATADDPRSMNFVRKHTWPTRPSTAVTSRPRRCGSSATPRAPTAPTSTTSGRQQPLGRRGRARRHLSVAQVLRLRRDGKAAAQPQLLGSVLADVSWPTRTSIPSSSASPPSISTSTPSAASAAP